MKGPDTPGRRGSTIVDARFAVRLRAVAPDNALEAVAPVVGKSASRAATRLASLQDALGDHQDAVVAAEWIERAALQSDEIDTAFVAGGLAEKFVADRRRLRQEWPNLWKGARRVYRAEPGDHA